jgi:CRISPR-associated protein Cas1
MLRSILRRFTAALTPPDNATPANDNGATNAPATAAPIHVFADHGLVHLDDGHLVIKIKSGETSQSWFRLSDVAQISIHGEAGITTPCLRALMQHGIPIVFRSRSGHYTGQLVDLVRPVQAIRRAQYRAAENSSTTLDLARTFVHAKIVNARGVVRRHTPADKRALQDLAAFTAKAKCAENLESLRGFEGAASARYFQVLPGLIAARRRAAFPFDGRKRRPPTDPVNALLSYLYAILAGECAAAAAGAGLDTNVGFLHAERPGCPALALDLIEALRPAVCDSLMLSLVNQAHVAAGDFRYEENSACFLSDTGRRTVLAALEKRLAQPFQAQTQASKNVRASISAEAHVPGKLCLSSRPFCPASARHGACDDFRWPSLDTRC